MPLVAAYHRPTGLQEAVALLADDSRVPLGGGTVLNADRRPSTLEAVDLQSLDLHTVEPDGDRLRVGAMVTLDRLAADAATPAWLAAVAAAELPSTLWTAATVGGTVAQGDGDSVLLAALLASGGSIEVTGPGGARTVDLAALLAEGVPSGHLVTMVTLATDGVGVPVGCGRTPADVPIVAAVARVGADGSTALALTGVAAHPVLVDPTDPAAALDPPADFRGSTAYRRHLARVLGARAVAAARAPGAPEQAAARAPGAAASSPSGAVADLPPTPTSAAGADLVVTFELNGRPVTTTVAPTDDLRAVLRRLGMLSVHYGSDSGETGAAAVLIDGRLVSADVVLGAQIHGHAVTTVEALNTGPELHPIQAAFVAVGAFQSGYSAGAMILGTLALLETDPDPDDAAIRHMLSGILDRETAYVKPVEAVRRAAAMLRGETPEPFGPLILTPKTDGTNPVPHDPADPAPDAPIAVPRLIPSQDVPDMAVVGKPEVKVDAVKLAKGNPAFTDDIELRGTLVAKLLTSPHAHARIVDIDDREAVALPGVHAVLHHKNVARVKYASGGQSWPNPHPHDQVSFDDKVRHVGDRVAAVAAETLEIAEEAVRRIKVTYEVLPAVFDEREAMADNAPVIHDEDDTVEIFDAERNVVHQITAQRGDVDEAISIASGPGEGERVFTQTFRVHQVQQCPIEPHISIAWLDEDERMVIRTATQVPFHTRRMVAPLLGMDIKDIRVIKPRIGGGFGAKQEMLIEDIVGHLAIATRRPVRLELTRSEEFISSRTRHPQTLTYTTVVDADATIVAQDLHILGNTGPYGTHGYTVQTVSGLRGLTSYNAASKRFHCDVVYTNIPVPGAYRGYGAPQAEFALEAHLEDVARELGMDVIEFKRRNWVKVGSEMDIAPHLGERAVVEGELDEYPKVMSSGIEECVAQAQREIGWHRRDDPAWVAPADRPHIRRGIGFAFCMHGTAIPFLDMGGCSIKLNDDGSFNMLVGATDLGTGADTVLGQIAAEVLGVPLEDIKVYSSDTDVTPFDTGAYASSTTYISGTAALQAAEAVRKRLKERAAMLLEVDEPCTIELRDRKAYAPDGRSVSLEDIALDSLHWQEQEQIMGTSSYVSPDCPPPFAAQMAEIELDVETGQVTVVKLVMAVDCGVAINPITASGQVEGGMIQALGYAHCEEYAYDESGRMLNDSFGPYKIYRADEMPETVVYLVQTMEDSGPFGAKAVAEIPKDGVAPAIRNAIVNATDGRVAINDLPFTPERVFDALRSSES